MLRAFARRLIHGKPGPSQWDRLLAEGVVSVGTGTYGQYGIIVHEFRVPDGSWVGARLRIGKYCSIAPCEVFLGGNHHTEWVSQWPIRSMYDMPGRERDGTNSGDITIGNDVWLGHGCTIMSGVTIGDGAVVAAKALVTKDVRPYAMVGGVPARELRRRFDDATVERVQAMRWWDWPAERIKDSVDVLNEPPR